MQNQNPNPDVNKDEAADMDSVEPVGNDGTDEDAAAIDAETVDEAEVLEGDEAASSQETVDDGSRIIELEAALADSKDKLMRAMAETENVRRRAQREREDASKYAIASFSKEILSVADNMTRAVASMDDEFRKNNDEVETLMVGLEMAEREMMTTLEKFGIKRIEAEGCKFDHNFHEAMFEYEDKEKPAGTVTQVIETGYTVHGRLLRPAKVGVTKGGPKTAPVQEVNTDAAEQQTDGSQSYETPNQQPGGQLDEEL